jgi:hypothetical protein
MLHIRPVEEKNASEEVKKTYEDIKKTLNIHFVPLLFQYIAGFEEWFLYVWEKIKTNLQSDYYRDAVTELISASEKSVKSVYHESSDMRNFAAHLQHSEKEQILQTAPELEILNAILLVLTIGLREGVKGVVIGQQMLPKNVDYEETVFDAFINEKIMHQNVREQKKDIAPAHKMLAPLFGQQSIVISKYPAFFTHIAKEMEELTKTEKYLHERVAMEHIALLRAGNLPYPLGCSYAEIARFAGKKPYFSELLHILSETFPTSFPRLLFTSSVMKQVLQLSSGKAITHSS